MSDLSVLLEGAKQGDLATCQQCPWNPTTAPEKPAFGISCRDHGSDYDSSDSAISVQVAQDPGGTSPERTELLCFVHNTDGTARNARALWKAGVARQWDDWDSDKDQYIQTHYWTNAIMHGFPQASRLRKQEAQAREQCLRVLREQIQVLSPKVIIALGKKAADSLLDAELLKTRWEQFSSSLTTGAYEESIRTSGINASIFCTYHTSDRNVNQAVSQRYSSDTEMTLDRRLNQLEDQTAARAFLEANSRRYGMKVLLLHWLDIGDAIRREHGV